MKNKKNWLKVGRASIIASGRGRTLVNQDFLVNGRREEFVLYTCKSYPVVILPLTPDNKVILVKQFRPGANLLMTELPGGNIGKNERPKDAARRELLEETGFISDDIIPTSKKVVWFDPSVFVTHYRPFIALNCIKIKPPEDGIEIELCPLKRWLKLCQNGKIFDSKSIATTMLASKYIKI